MQRLFEGKKTAYTPADLQMKSLRLRLLQSKRIVLSISVCILAEELMHPYEIAKKNCFFAEEQILVSFFQFYVIKERERRFVFLIESIQQKW